MAGFLKKLLKEEHAGIVSSLIETATNRERYAGDPALDWCIKGWHTAGMNLIYGPSGSGKSAMALKAAADAWAENPDGYVVIFDSEFYYYKNKANYARIAEFGIPLEKVILVSQNTIGALFKTLPDLEEDIASGGLKVAAIIWDSVGGVQNKAAEAKMLKGEVEDAGDAHRGNAKHINPIIGLFNRITALYGFPLFAVQHCIKNQEQYGEKWLLLGGERLKFLAQRSVCVESSQAKDSRLTVGDQPFDTSNPDAPVVGKKVLVKCAKTRAGVEGNKAEFWFNFVECRFARPEISLFNLATKLGVIYHPEINGKVNNVWWAYNLVGNEVKAQGAAKMQEMLAKDKELFGRVMADCCTSTKSAGTDEHISDDTVVFEGNSNE